MKVDGSNVSVFSPSTKTKVDLTQNGSDLMGKVAFANGNEFALTLRLTPLSNKFDGKYTGTSRGDRGCGSIVYELDVKQSLITGWARVQGSRGGAVTEGSSDSVITGEINADGAALIESRGSRNVQYSGAISNNELTASDPPIGKSQCSYELKLTRR